MPNIVIQKSDKKIMSFGFEDISRFSPSEYEIRKTTLERLPDEISFCKFENEKIIIDNILKREAKEKKEREKLIQEKIRELAIKELEKEGKIK